MPLFRRLLMLALVLAVAGCARQAPGPDDTNGAAQDGAMPQGEDSAFQLGPEDQLRVQVWGNPDLSVDVPVRPDGMISVPLIGDVRAGGRQPEEVASAIEGDLDEYVRDPNVTVIVTELNSHQFLSRVRVTGAVENPLSLPYRQGMTVLDLVLEGGGLTEFAAANRATLYRRTGGETQQYRVDLEAILERGDMETNSVLQPGDVIAVPERFF